MSYEFDHAGDTFGYTPNADVAQGTLVFLGDVCGVAERPIAANVLGALTLRGVFPLPKATTGGSAIAAGKRVMWDPVNLIITTVASAGFKTVGTTEFASIDADASQMVKLDGFASGAKKLVGGQITFASAKDTIATGLTSVDWCGATLNSDPVLTCDGAQADPGNQAGAPIAGSIFVSAWMPTSNANPTRIAATGFAAKKASWWAFGAV